LALAVTFLLVSPAAPQSTILNFSTYLGAGGQDFLRDLATDPAGNIYAVGGTSSSAFPVTLGPAFNSGSCSTLGSAGRMDVFLAKFSPSGQLLWSRFLGGPCYDRAYAVELDASGNIYVAGRAGAGFPTTAGALQTAFGGDTDPNNLYGHQDGFVTKLNPSGAVLWSTYFGGNDPGIIRDIAVDASGNVYPVMQHVTGPQPHVTPGAFRTTLPGGEDMVVAKLTAAGQLVWGSYYGGSAYEGQGASIRVDSGNQPVVLAVTTSNNLPTRNAHQATRSGGNDFALAKFTADGSNLVFSTYLGGSADEGVETHHLEIGPQDVIYMAGVVRSSNFPTTPDAYQRVAGGGIDVGLATFTPSGQLTASSYFGGAGTDGVEGIALDAAGNVVFAGTTTTVTHTQQSVATGGFQTTLNGTLRDAYVVRMSADLRQNLYVSYLGGSAEDEGRAAAIAPDGSVIVGGQSESNNYPVQNAHDSTFGGGVDGFITSLRLPGGPAPTPAPPTPRNLVIIR
jgi:hypothetical protein